jgi:NADPH:quinone reductase-like Zn-dependent oxidoreductase
MKAAVLHEHGGPEVLRIDEVETPVPGAGEVRIAVEACALNHLDLFVRRGIPGVAIPFPHVGASDFAGRIDVLGAGVSGWSEGDRVLANPSLWCGRCPGCREGRLTACDDFRIIGEHTWGGAAEHVIAPAANLVALPDEIGFEAAAAVPLTFQTAFRALFTQAGLQVGESVLILGASGGVAVAATQMARVAGATVYAVTSGAENVERVRALGADVVLDRQEVDFAREIWRITEKRGVDVVLESTGQATWKGAMRSLARGGRLVTYGATTGPRAETDLNLLFWKQLRLIGSTMALPEEFRRAMALFTSGRVSPAISHVLPLAEIREAHEVLESGRQFGKVVLRVRG